MKSWPSLHSLNVGKNNLDCAALQILKKSKWRNIVCLNLCTDCSMKGVTT